MAEVSVEFIKGEKHMTWYSDDFATIRRMKKLREEFPEDVTTLNEDDESLLLHIPISWFREPKPRTKRTMSEEQRAAAKERLAYARLHK